MDESPEERIEEAQGSRRKCFHASESTRLGMRGVYSAIGISQLRQAAPRCCYA